MKILHTEDSHPHSTILHEPQYNPAGTYSFLLYLARGDNPVSGVTGYMLRLFTDQYYSVLLLCGIGRNREVGMGKWIRFESWSGDIKLTW